MIIVVDFLKIIDILLNLVTICSQHYVICNAANFSIFVYRQLMHERTGMRWLLNVINC